VLPFNDAAFRLLLQLSDTISQSAARRNVKGLAEGHADIWYSPPSIREQLAGNLVNLSRRYHIVSITSKLLIHRSTWLKSYIKYKQLVFVL